MRTEFYEIIPELLRREGGLSINENDRGGATNWGVSLVTLRRLGIDVDKDGDIDADDIRVMPMELAVDIFKREYWDPSKADRLPDRIKEFYFDCCINHGINRAVMIMQNAVCIQGEPITVDGLLGPQTLGHLKYITVNDAVDQRLYFFSGLCRKDPTQMTFRKGWFKRALEFRI